MGQRQDEDRTWIDEAADRFERAWKAGQKPRIEDYLDTEAEPRRSRLLDELVRVEREIRGAEGTPATRDEFRLRFPDHAAVIDAVFGIAPTPPRVRSRPSATSNSDRNLLFGILALQMDFISRDALIAAMNAWVLDKPKTLGEILVAQGALDPRDRALLEPMVARHVQMHGGDPAQSLAAVGSASSAREKLEAVADFDVQASLGHLGAAPDDADPDRTPSYVGESTAAGGRFRILRFHDRGNLGEVFIARDQELHREVALKQIKEEHADDAQRRARFLVEAEITGGLEHPGIVPVYGLGTHDSGRPFYAMRFIQGDNLKDAIAKFHQADAPRREPGERAVAFRKLLGRFLDVCDAMAYAHSRGVLHRDLKPGNIMLGKYGETLVVDWGLAKSVGRPDVAGQDAERTLEPESGSAVKSTEMGARIGTPAYMSPEQAAGRLDELGPASDVYSLGATLYCVLTGKSPFPDRDMVELLRKVERGEFLPPRAVSPQVDRGLDAICRKAMALRLEDRYASPNLLAEDIEHWLADEPVSALPESRSQRLARWTRRHRVWAQAGAAALLLVTIVSFVATGFVNQARERAEERRKEADKQRGLADERRKEADKQRGLADEQRKEADKQRHQAEWRLANSDLDRGLSLCEQGDYNRGVLWLARGLEHAPTDATDLKHAIRMNLDSWCQQFYCPLGYLKHASRVDAAAFSPDGKTIATGSWDKTARLWDAATTIPIGPPLQHQSGVKAVAFSPDGKTLATASWDKTARLWDVATAKPIGPPLQHQGVVTDVTFSPDGKIIAMRGRENIVGRWPAGLWDAATAKPIGLPLQHQGYFSVVAFSPDGKTIATDSGDETARLWDAATAKPIGPPMQHQRRVEAVAFSPDGKTLATASWDKTARLWDVATAKPIGPPLQHPGVVTDVTFSPDGKIIATASSDNTARLWDAATAKPVGAPLQHQAGPHRPFMAFSPDGKTIATGSGGRTAQLWDTATAKPIGPPMQHQVTIWAVTFSPDGKTIATGGWDNTARLWDATTAKPVGASLQLQGGEVRFVAFSPDGTTILTGDFSSTVRLWDAAMGNPRSSTLQHQSGVNAVTFSPDGKSIATASRDKTARLWDAATAKPIGPSLQHQDMVNDVAFSPDGKIIATASSDNTARLWDAATAKPIGPPMQHQRQVVVVAFSPDGKTIATSCRDSSVRLWNAATGMSIGPSLQHPDWVWAVAFSPDGKTIATGSRDKMARLWDATTAKPIGPPMQHRDIVYAVAFSPDGKTLGTGSWDKTARLWDAATAMPIGPPLRHQGMVTDVTFSPDGKIIATASDDETARLWDAATAKPIGPPMQHQARVEAVAFSPDGERIATASWDSSVRLWDVPTPMSGDVERLVLWTQVLSNMELDASDASHALDGPDWDIRRQALEKLGGPPGLLKHSPERPLARHQREALSSERAGQWFAARWHLDRLITLTPKDGSLYVRRGNTLDQLGKFAEAVTDYDKAIEREYDRDGPTIYTLRGIDRARLGRWAEADTDFAKAAERGAEFYSWSAHALLRLQLGDDAGYREACERILARFEKTEEPSSIAYFVVHTCILAPEAVTDPTRLVRLAGNGVARNPQNSYALNMLGAALCRAGRSREAVGRLEEAIRLSQDKQGTPSDWLFLALAYHDLGRGDEARRWLDRAVPWIDQRIPKNAEGLAYASGLPWLRLELPLLRSEAEALINEGRSLYLPADVFQALPAPSPGK